MSDRAALLRRAYEEHSDPLRRYVVRLTGDHTGADDVVQEALLRAWDRADILKSDADRLRAWLLTVARNLVIDDARSARTRREVRTAAPPDPETVDSTERIFDSMVVADALASLGQAHREVVVSAYYGSRSVAEISDELEIPPGTVKSRMHYGLRALRQALQEKGVTTR